MSAEAEPFSLPTMATIAVESPDSAGHEADELYADDGRSARIAPTDRLVTAREAGHLIGIVRLCQESGEWMLRSLLVRADRRGRGIGAAMLARLERLIEQMAVSRIYCLAYRDLEDLYRGVGFDEIDPVKGPSFLRERMAERGEEDPRERFILLRR